MDFTSKTLLVVDPQNDFMLGGSLPVPDGDSIIPVVNRLIELFNSNNAPVFISRDWHPADHCSFIGEGGKWPPHCVKDTEGALFHPDLILPESSEVIDKAVIKEPDAYSAFQDTGLANILKIRGLTDIYTCGLATDVCVRSTVLDGLRAGFKMYVIEDAARAVETNPGDGEKAICEMEAAGAVIIESPELFQA
jgi:nicotinamidase/pyrazinamidase